MSKPAVAVAATSELSQPTVSQSKSVSRSAEGELADAIAHTDVQSLVELLESESARTEFLGRLKALAKNQNNEKQPALAVSEILDLKNGSGALTDGYTQLLERLNLTDNQLGKMIATLGAIILLVLLYIIVHGICRWSNAKLKTVRKRFYLSPNRLALLSSLPVKICFAFVVAFAVVAIAEIWAVSWLLPGHQLGYPKLLNVIMTCSVIAYGFAVFWEGANALMEYSMRHSNQISNARVDTVLPVMRKVVLVFLVILFGLIALSELGINIVPLLAGAGVFGIALGFGAQTLVQDFLVGFIIILEDLLQIGDVVKVSGRMGTVEKISIRKLQLRGLDGTVYTIPFSELDIIENYTKDYSYYLTDIGVAYKEDVDAVIDCIKSVSNELREDDAFANMMLDDIEILGLDKFADSAIVIRVRLKTRPHDRWSLGREFNRRLKYAFDANDIEIPFPHRTLMLGENIGPKLQVPEDQVES